MIYIGMYKFSRGEKRTTFQPHKNEYILSLNTSFVQIRMSGRVSGRISTGVYNILSTLLK